MRMIKKTMGILAAAMIGVFLCGRLYAQSELIVLCYHDVPKTVVNDKFGVDQATFINTIEYFRTHGFEFVGLKDILAAKKGEKELPRRSVFLTFDDAYQSFYNFVFPILEEYDIPSMLTVVTSWIGEKRPEYVKHPLMSWEQIREVAQSPLVDVASHSHDLHRGMVYNPQGNEAASINRQYFPQENEYEDLEDYRRRIRRDLKKAKDLLESKTFTKVKALVWPYGAYNKIVQEVARDVGYEIDFALQDKKVRVDDFDIIERYLVYKNPTTKGLLKDLDLLPKPPRIERVVQADLDYLYDEDPQQREKNLSAFLDRIKTLKPTAVYLQAFSDTDATGNIKSVYFPNRVLPIKGDYFNRVVHQLKTRVEIKVYAWMPMLSIELPDEDKNSALKVHEYGDPITLSDSWYNRLSPFSKETVKILKMLYADLAKNAQIDGIVFQDDGYLNDEEDFHPDALDEYKQITGGKLLSPEELTQEQRDEWTQVKTRKLNGLTKELMASVKEYRPEAKFGRTMYAPVILNEESETWFAQDYESALRIYDFVIVMAYPYMEGVVQQLRWLKKLVAEAQKHPQGIKKTLFKVQAYDWERQRWVKEERMRDWITTLVAAGALHVGYYPDDYMGNHPDLDKIRPVMSVEDFPFKRDWE